MKKKLFGVTISTIIQIIVCIIVAFIIWLFAKNFVDVGEDASAAVGFCNYWLLL